jgi:processing peptidase subunit alpha
VRDSPSLKIDLAFETVPWSSDDVPTFFVMNTLIGNATSFSSGGPGKGMYCRAITNLMQRYSSVNVAGAINNHYCDTGVFGISVQGISIKYDELLRITCEEIKKLAKPIPELELLRAKNILKMNVLMAMERRDERLEEIARNFMTYDNLTFMQYLPNIDKVTSNDINRVVEKLIKGPPTLVAFGGHADRITPKLLNSYLQ